MESGVEGVGEVKENANQPGKLWYQRLRLDNNIFLAVVIGGWIAEYAHLPFTIGLPLGYFLSFNALSMYVDLGVLILMILYPRRLFDRFHTMIDQLQSKDVVSEDIAGQMRENARRAIYGRAEKYIPLIIGAIVSTAWVYHEFSKGLYGVLDFPDMQGNVSTVYSFPITVIHETIAATALLFIPIIGFSTFIVIWRLLRSMVPSYEKLNVDVMSPRRAGGLDPIGKLMVEVVLLVMVISTTYAALGAVYYILTSQFHPAILFVAILSYGFLFVLMVPPVYGLHKIMAKKKKEVLDQLSGKIRNLRKQVTLGNLRDEKMGELSSLLQIHEEVGKMRTFPLDVSSSRKIVMFFLSPALASVPALLEPYLGKTVSFIPIVILFSIITQLISFKIE
jgi:hypothetical protein